MMRKSSKAIKDMGGRLITDKVISKKSGENIFEHFMVQKENQ